MLAFGPGHLSQSSSPGKGGHCILFGHRDIGFAILAAIRTGDVLNLDGRGGSDNFVVQTTRIVQAEELYLDGKSEGFLSLFTCFPFKAIMPGTPFRYVVTAKSG